MTMRIKTWQEFKDFFVNRSLNVQHHETSSKYYLTAIDGPMKADYVIDKDIPANADQVDFETNYKPYSNKSFTDNNNRPVGAAPVFKDKVLPDGKKLYNRTTGKKFTAIQGFNIFTFAIPFTQMKFTGIEVINCEIGDKVDLFVTDDATGSYTTVPNYELNQFGFEVNMPDKFYTRESNYDADLFQGMIVKAVYNSASAKDVYINYLIHEVKE